MQIIPPAHKTLILTDTQFPDENKKAIELIKKFIPYFKPDRIIFGGDIVNFTNVSHYGYPADYEITINDELILARNFLKEIALLATKANQYVQLTFLEGNHEQRLQKYLFKSARELYNITDPNDDQVLTVSYLLGLDKLNIKFVPYSQDIVIEGAIIHHGDRVRKKAGYTAYSYLEDFGESTVVGHTHRAGLVFKTLANRSIFGMETGCLCNREMKVPYVRHPDWMPAFGILYYNIESNTLHPTLIPIINNEFVFGGKIFN